MYVYISCPVLRTDDSKAHLTLVRVKDRIANLPENVIVHDNIDSSCLSKGGLHLNAKGSSRLAMNFISLMKRL